MSWEPSWKKTSFPAVTALGRVEENGPEMYLLRLDQLHPEVSGNKWFKLKYNLQAAALHHHAAVLTFGGPWSNHIAATAAACQLSGIKSIGLIRGAEPARWSDTLLEARQRGMELHFLTREAYLQKEDPLFLDSLKQSYGDVYIIPEGGNNPAGIKGCREILSACQADTYTHLCVPVGTGATLTGIASAAAPQQRVLGFSALKGAPDEALMNLCYGPGPSPKLIRAYTFGGFAKKTPALLEFMQAFRRQHGILLDFVYTAKMMYGINDLIRNGFFDPKARILAIHTGGQQGNRSLDPTLGLLP